MIRVAIVDDHPVVREGTAALLAAQPGIVIAGTAGSVDEARAMLGRIAVDVVLFDIRLGTESGLGLLAGQAPGVGTRPAILVLTAYDYPQYAEAALRLGAAGFVVKTAPMPSWSMASEGRPRADWPSPRDPTRRRGSASLPASSRSCAW